MRRVYLFELYILPDGSDWIFLVLFVVMASDSMAYFVGKTWGRHRLYEAVSPKKSIEGSLGGLAGGVLGAMLCKILLFSELSSADVLLLGIGVGAFSQPPGEDHAFGHLSGDGGPNDDGVPRDRDRPESSIRVA